MEAFAFTNRIGKEEKKKLQRACHKTRTQRLTQTDWSICGTDSDDSLAALVHTDAHKCDISQVIEA